MVVVAFTVPFESKSRSPFRSFTVKPCGVLDDDGGRGLKVGGRAFRLAAMLLGWPPTSQLLNHGRHHHLKRRRALR